MQKNAIISICIAIIVFITGCTTFDNTSSEILTNSAEHEEVTSNEASIAPPTKQEVSVIEQEWDKIRKELPYTHPIGVYRESYPGVTYEDSEYIKMANYLEGFMRIGQMLSEEEHKVMSAFYNTAQYIPQPDDDPLVLDMLEKTGFIAPDYKIDEGGLWGNPVIKEHIERTYEIMYGGKLDLNDKDEYDFIYSVGYGIYVAAVDRGVGGYGGPDCVPIILDVEKLDDKYIVSYLVAPYDEGIDGSIAGYVMDINGYTHTKAIERLLTDRTPACGVLEITENGFGRFRNTQYTGRNISMPVYDKQMDTFLVPAHADSPEPPADGNRPDTGPWADPYLFDEEMIIGLAGWEDKFALSENSRLLEQWVEAYRSGRYCQV